MNDVCVCCGAYVPEGTMVCSQCIKESQKPKDEKKKDAKFTFLFIGKGGFKMKKLWERFKNFISNLFKKREA